MLRAHLLALAAETDEHPLLHLQTAAAGRDLQTAGDWPLYSTGASQGPRLPTQDRCRGFPVFQKRFKIIPFGASIWRSGRNSLSASQIRFETALARTANSRYGHRRAATRLPPSLVKSLSGAPPSASTPKTADQPEQHSYKRRPPFGNTTSTAGSPGAATTAVVLTFESARLMEPHVIAGTKIDSGCPNHPRSAQPPHPAPAYRNSPEAECVAQNSSEAGEPARRPRPAVDEAQPFCGARCAGDG
jgi:hypothetical protein